MFSLLLIIIIITNIVIIIIIAIVINCDAFIDFNFRDGSLNIPSHS